MSWLFLHVEKSVTSLIIKRWGVLGYLNKDHGHFILKCCDRWNLPWYLFRCHWGHMASTAILFSSLVRPLCIELVGWINIDLLTPTSVPWFISSRLFISQATDCSSHEPAVRDNWTRLSAMSSIHHHVESVSHLEGLELLTLESWVRCSNYWANQGWTQLNMCTH